MMTIPPITIAVAVRCAPRSRRAQLIQPAANHLHPRIHFVCFWVLHFEVAPISAANKRGNLLPASLMLPLVLAMNKFLEAFGWQRPFRHLAIAAFRNVDLADRRHLLERLRRRDHTEPASVLDQGVKESPQPAV